MKAYAHRETQPCLCLNCWAVNVADLVLAASGLPAELHIDARKMAKTAYYQKKSIFETVQYIRAELLKKEVGS